VTEAASYAKSQADRVTLATVTLPRVLIGAGIVLLLGGIVVTIRQRRRPQHPAPVVAASTNEERISVSSGV
jgi:hypothetical protein